MVRLRFEVTSMKKFAFCAILSLLMFRSAADDQRYFEAEEYKDNGIVKNDQTASGGKSVFGQTWYVMAKNVPIPPGKSFCFARVRSSAPANWFLAYDPQKPFGWFKTSGGDQWEWIRIGQFSASEKNKGLMPKIFLQKPSGGGKTVSGWLDVLVFAASASEAQTEFDRKNAPSPDSPAETSTPASKGIYLEAEEFKGNGTVKDEPSASGGKAVFGKTWYVLVKNMPIPDSADGMYCFVRVRSTMKAQWFLAYDPQKPFGWFRTPGEDKWVWVCIGKFRKSDKNQGVMPQLFLQKPVGTSAKTVDGAADAVVFSESNNPKTAEELFQENHKKKAPDPADSSGKLSAIVNVQRFYSVKKVFSPPIIDGNLDDAAYGNVPEAADFILLGGKRLATQKTAVKAVWCGDTLYIAAKLDEARMPLLRKLRTKDNDSVWSDDCFEIYLDPGHTRKRAFQLVVNPNGAKQDTSLKRRIDEAGFSDLKLSWKTAVKRFADHWTVEAAIPLKLLSFQEVKPGTVWGVNFCRSEIPFGEKSFWNNTGEYFLRPERYAILHFGDAPGNPQSIEADSRQGGIRITFAPDQPETIILSGKISGSNDATVRKINLSSKKKSALLPVSGKERKYSVDVCLSSPGKVSTFAVDFRNYRDGLLSCLWPSEERNNRLPILYGTAQHAFWLFANHTKAKAENLRAEIQLPAGLDLLDPTTDVKYEFYRRCKLVRSEKIFRGGTPYTRHVISVEGVLAPVNIRKLPFHQGITIFITCSDPALISRKLPVYTRIFAGDLSEEENETTVEILPEIRGISPKKLVVHNWLWTWNPFAGCVDAVLKTMRAVGFNSLEAGGAQFYPGRREAFRKYGFPLINNLWWEFHGKKASFQAVKFNGSTDSARLCPTAMLADGGKLLLENRARQLADIRDGAEGIVWDLEGPYCWDVCFCSRCVEKFRSFAGIPADAKLSPQIIREQHNGPWIDFCCRQSTEICRILRHQFKQINPQAKFGFYSGLPSFDTKETYRADWYDAIGDIDLALLSYYTASFTSLDDSFQMKMKEHIKKLKTAAAKKNNPGLQVWATLTPGYARNSSMAPSAELVKLKVLRSFSSGMDGVSFWWWGPFDGDYYRKLAEATAIIGKYERFFLQGESPVSLKVQTADGKRFSSFSSTDSSGTEFFMLMNHSAAALEVSFQNPGGRRWLDEIGGGAFSERVFRRNIPPYGVLTLVSEK